MDSIRNFARVLTGGLLLCSQCQVYDPPLLDTASAGASGNGGSGGMPTNCSDGVVNGRETGIDCGGGECARCVGRSPCKADLDCQSGSCVEDVCTVTDCTDGIKLGLESDEDCGGPDCPRCEDERSCNVAADCESGVCADGLCELQASCKDILVAAEGSEDGLYWIDIDGPAGALDRLQVNCSMLPRQMQQAGGWTRVAFEPAASGGPQKQGALGHLEEESGTPDQIARGLSSGSMGKRFNGFYDSVMITWGNDWLEFVTPEDLFVSDVRASIPLTLFSTNNILLNQWVGDAGVSSDSAIFCRASAVDVNPGGTSWALKSKALEDADAACGCSGKAWEGRGIFYGGSVPPSFCSDLPATSQGGGFASTRQHGEQKGGIQSPTDLILWVR